MGHSHSHAHPHDATDQPRVGPVSRAVVVALLALAALGAVLGVVRLWPDADRVEALSGSVGFAADGVTFPDARVDEVRPPCEVAQGDPGADPGANPGASGELPGTPLQDGTCGTVAATITTGADRGREVVLDVPPEVSDAGLEPGDTLELQLTPPFDDQPGQASYFGIDRSTPLLVLLVVFVVVVLAVARLRGLMALVGLSFSAAVIARFVLPALLTGESAVAVAVAGSTAIMFVVLFTTHGVSMRTATALLGTLAGVGVSALVGVWAIGSARLTGVSDESGGILLSFADGLDFQGLLLAAIIIAGLGVLNDVTITQSSAVWELRAASPGMSRLEAFTSAMRIGRDHIASTIYTIVFVYAGAALTVLLVISLYDRPVLDLLETEELAGEVVRSLASSIGLVLAVPLTTAIAALTVGRPGTPGDRPGDRPRPGGRRAAGRRVAG